MECLAILRMHAKINPNICSCKKCSIGYCQNKSNWYFIRVFASMRKRTGFEWKNVGRSPDASWHLRIVCLPSCKVVGERWYLKHRSRICYVGTRLTAIVESLSSIVCTAVTGSIRS